MLDCRVVINMVTILSGRSVMRYRHAAVLAVVIGASASGGLADAASSVQAYALSAAGESALGSVGGGLSCSTFGPDPRTNYFPSVYQVSLPDAGCGVGVDARSASAATGGVTVASNLAVGFGNSSQPRAFIGQSKGRAGFGN